MRRRRWLRWIARGFGGILLVLVLAVGAGWLWLYTGLPQIDGRIALAGLDAPVEIIRDRNAVPHIRAETERDAYFALGFVHAQDRLFQMESMRRSGAGRLSELAGPATLPLDRFMRVLGLYRLAEAGYAHLDAPTRAAVDAYSAGVNAQIESRSGALPVELEAARLVRPFRGGPAVALEPWRPADSLVWGRMMALRLSGNWMEEALRAALADRLTPEQIEALWPPPSRRAPPTVPARAEGIGAMLAALLDAVPQEAAQVSASNSWALSGEHTASGRPILANDPHLGFRAPGLWYLARIETPEFTLTGATVPGVPFMLLGHNGVAAWSLTTTDSDIQDLYLERVDPDDSSRYLTEDGPVPFATREEVIAIAGGAAERWTVRETRHGPVVSDLGGELAAARPPGQVVALASPLLREDDLTPQAIRAMGRARDWASFRAALRDFHTPQQNITYADIHGTIGFMAPGRVPIRRKGRGEVPVPGWTGEYGWDGTIPFDELPQAVNPASGRIVNANHRIVGDDYPYWLGRFANEPYRAERIFELLGDLVHHDRTTTTLIQLDIVSRGARELLPLMREMEPAGEASARALALLGDWDGAMLRDRPEPLIFKAWLAELNRAIYADELGPYFPLYWSYRPGFVKHVLTRAPEWCNDITTPRIEVCAELLAGSLRRAMDRLAARHGADIGRWQWGDAHRAHHRHTLFGSVPVLNRLFDLTIPADGGAYTVNRAQSRLRDGRGSFASVHGPGLRAVYDLADLDSSLFILATGQSGNVLSRHYRDMLRPWRDGRYIRIPGARETARDGARGVLTLVPSGP